jgi:D-serine deaminase-like pyridoxal phosphate-dependent protein
VNALDDKVHPASQAVVAVADDIDTPFLLLDPSKLARNVSRLQDRLQLLCTGLRPHVKTAKSLEIAGLLFDGATGPITVSTLKEAEAFAAAGYTDMIYAVGIAPHKTDRVIALHKQGVDLAVLLDSVDQASAVAHASRQAGLSIPALIEVDCDGHRAGLLPGDPLALQIAATLEEGGAELRGILTHAGESYFCGSENEHVAAAENERAAALRVAEDLRGSGFRCPVVSIGSTPTAHFARDLTGVTEVRAGNFVFFDLVMAGIGVCTLDDLALSVVTTVIGHRPDKGWILTDGGWMATSRDRGTADQPVDQGYGLVANLDGTLYPDLLMSDASQEHGIVSRRDGDVGALPNIPLGSKLRILPNHACATAAQHECYHVLEPGSTGIRAVWPRIQGW